MTPLSILRGSHDPIIYLIRRSYDPVRRALEEWPGRRPAWREGQGGEAVLAAGHGRRRHAVSPRLSCGCETNKKPEIEGEQYHDLFTAIGWRLEGLD